MENRNKLLSKLDISLKRLRTFSCPEMKDVYSYQYFKDILKTSINNYTDTYSFIFGDFNKLGIINDVYGHKFGTKALNFSIEIIKKCLPSNTSIVRAGGDEFYMILPNCNKENANKYCNKIHNALSKNSTLVGGLSIEVAATDSTYGNIDELINITDTEITNIKSKKKENDSPIDILLDDFLPLSKPDSISKNEDKIWDELNKRINTSIYNFLQNFRPSKTLTFDKEQITDASSFITSNFAYLLNEKIDFTLSDNKNCAYIQTENYQPFNTSIQFSNLNPKTINLIHSLVSKSSDVNINNLSNNSIITLTNLINKLTENLIRDNTGLLSKHYFRLFLAQQLSYSDKPLSATFISAAGIKLSNSAFDHSFTDYRLARTNTVFLDIVKDVLEYNNSSFSVSTDNIHLISQGAGNYLFLYPKEKSFEIQPKIQIIVDKVNNLSNIKDFQSSFKIAYYSTKNNQPVLKNTSYNFINYIRKLKEEANYKKDPLKKLLFQSPDASITFKKSINSCIDYYLENIPNSSKDINKISLLTKNVHKALLNHTVLHNSTKHTIKTTGIIEKDDDYSK